MNDDLDQLDTYKARRTHLRKLNKSNDEIQRLSNRVSELESTIAVILQRLEKWQ